MTDCIFEAINSNMQASISALTGRQCPSISHDWLSAASAALSFNLKKDSPIARYPGG
jgi:hypothetical protein